MIETIGSEEEARRVVYASYNNVIEDVVVGLNRWAWRHRREAFPMFRDAEKPEPPVIFFEANRHDLP